jgi:hypothetical protein
VGSAGAVTRSEALVIAVAAGLLAGQVRAKALSRNRVQEADPAAASED